MVPDLPTAAESAADSTNEIRKGRECRDKRCCGRSATSGDLNQILWPRGTWVALCLKEIMLKYPPSWLSEFIECKSSEIEQFID